MIQALSAQLDVLGVNIVGGPCLWPQHGKDYYAVYFKDPEGLKYEIVHDPHGA